jgi:uncharacterized damage-inducible protein DinB
MSNQKHIGMLTRYKAWANRIVFSALRDLPFEEVTKPRATRFGNMIHTLNHVYVIDSIFKAHLQARDHGYEARNTDSYPPLESLCADVAALDSWYVEYADKLDDEALQATINFEFIGGGSGSMTREQIILHVVNHGTYHRGFVGDMMYQASVTPPPTDLPVFIRDVLSAG